MMDNKLFDFVIFYDGIVGSTNLTSVLSKHSDIHCFTNIFGGWGDKTPEDAIKDYEKEVEVLKTWRTYSVLGMKYRHNVNEKITKMLLKRSDRFILMHRENVLEQCLSEAIKAHTNQPNIKQGQKPKDCEPFEIDLCDLRFRLNKKHNDLNYMNKWLLDYNFLRISYENLYQRKTEDTLRMLEWFLGSLDVTITLQAEGDYVKLNSTERYKRLIINYESIKNTFSSKRYGELED